MAGKKVQAEAGYEVGYGKPPKETQFQKGRSGNPTGRPKGSKNSATLLQEIVNEKVSVREGDRIRKMSPLEAMIRTTALKAMKGDPRAFDQIMRLVQKDEEKEATSSGRGCHPVLVVPGALSMEEWAKVAKEQQGASLDEVWQGLNRAKRLADLMEGGTPSEQREALLSAVPQIQVERLAIWITLKCVMLRTCEKEQRHEDGEEQAAGIIANDGQGEPCRTGTLPVAEDMVLHMPVSLTRRGNETKLMLTDGPAARLPESPDRALIKGVARAHSWWDELSTGRAASLHAIAAREGVTDRYVGQVINLAFLAPSIVEAVLSGTHASPLTAKALTLDEDIPLSWAEQHQMMQARRAG